MRAERWRKPAEVAELWGTNPSLIHSGELEAVDVSAEPSKGRPRWRITPDALERFAEKRSSRAKYAPEPAKANQRKQKTKAKRTYV
jgi:hypothetical protein